MKHRLLLTGALVTALVACGWLLGDDTKPPSPRSKGGMPAGWSKLGLSAEQRAKIRAIHMGYREKIESLQKQLREMEKQEHREMYKVLTDAQKTRLKEIIATRSAVEEEEPKAEKKTEPPGKSDKK